MIYPIKVLSFFLHYRYIENNTNIVILNGNNLYRNYYTFGFVIEF